MEQVIHAVEQYLIYNEKGEPLLFTGGYERKESCIEAYCAAWGLDWEYEERKGCTCRKARVSVEEIADQEEAMRSK